MKLGFLTMVWRDYWLLEKWVAHNSQWVPKTQLTVLNHGGDPKVDTIAAGCNVVHIPRDDITQDLTRRRWDLLAGVTNGLLAFYDRIVCTDVDELIICTQPGKTLPEYLQETQMETEALSPVGLNLIPTPDDRPNAGQTVLQNHPHALLSARYTKPCIVRSRVSYTVGGHGLIGGKFLIDPNLALCHLHYVTPDYAERMATRQDIVQQSLEHAPDPSLPETYWKNWSDPAYVKNKEFTAFSNTRAVDMSDGFAACVKTLNGAIHHAGRKMLLKPRKMVNEPRKVVLPEKYRALL